MGGKKSDLSALLFAGLPVAWGARGLSGWAPCGRGPFQRFEHRKRVLNRSLELGRHRKGSAWGLRIRIEREAHFLQKGRRQVDDGLIEKLGAVFVSRGQIDDRGHGERRLDRRRPSSRRGPGQYPELAPNLTGKMRWNRLEGNDAGLHDIGFETAAIDIFVRARARQFDYRLEGIDSFDAQPMCDSGALGGAGREGRLDKAVPYGGEIKEGRESDLRHCIELAFGRAPKSISP